MKRIYSIILLSAVMILASCKSQVQLKGKRYYLLMISDILMTEQELNFLSDNEVSISTTLLGSSSGIQDFRDPIFKRPKIYKYWVNNDTLEIPEYNGLIVHFEERNNAIGVSSGIPMFERGGLLYTSSVFNHLNDSDLIKRIQNVASDKQTFDDLMRAFKPKKKKGDTIYTYQGNASAVIRNFLSSHPDLSQLRKSDFDSTNLKFLIQYYQTDNPYFQEGDFNKDGLSDFAVLFKVSNESKKCLVIFNGVQNDAHSPALILDNERKSYCNYEDDANNNLFITTTKGKLSIGLMESCMCAILEPKDKGYDRIACPEE